MLPGVWRASTRIVFLCCTCGRLWRGESVCSPPKEMGTRHGLLWGQAGGSSTPQHTLPLLAPAPGLPKQAKDPRFVPGSWKTGVMLPGQVCKKVAVP